MMGKSHVACAAAGWALAAPPAAAALGHPLSPWELGLSLVIAAGAGVAPDIDHPDATIARTHGFASRLVAKGVAEVSGGHRHATHWLATGLTVGLVVTGLGLLWPRWVLAAAVATCGAWALRVTLPYQRRGLAPVAALLGAVLAYASREEVAWAGLAVGFGWVAHVIGDWVCKGSGVPVFGPFNTSRWAAGLFTIDGTVEHVVASLALLVTVLAFAWHL